MLGACVAPFVSAARSGRRQCSRRFRAPAR